jgi:hypothetical protein
MEEFGGLVFVIEGRDEVGLQPPTGFPLRLGLVCLTQYGPDGGGSEPWTLCRSIFERLKEEFGIEKITIKYGQGRPESKAWTFFCTILELILGVKKVPIKDPQSSPMTEQYWDFLMIHSDSKLYEDYRLPDELIFQRQGKSILIVQTQRWFGFDGGSHYTESVELSFFADSPPVIERVKSISIMVMAAIGPSIEVVSVDPAQVEKSTYHEKELIIDLISAFNSPLVFCLLFLLYQVETLTGRSGLIYWIARLLADFVSLKGLSFLWPVLGLGTCLYTVFAKRRRSAIAIFGIMINTCSIALMAWFAIGFANMKLGGG